MSIIGVKGPSRRAIGSRRRTAEVRKLTDLLEISQTLGSTLNLKSGLGRVLEILEEHHGALSGSIVLLRRDTGELASRGGGRA